jgi:hypothetical protein
MAALDFNHGDHWSAPGRAIEVAQKAMSMRKIRRSWFVVHIKMCV